MLEKTLESPLDCKEIQPVHSKGDQSWGLKARILKCLPFPSPVDLRYADDTTLMAESEEELKSHLTKVKEKTEKFGFSSVQLSLSCVQLFATP